MENKDIKNLPEVENEIYGLDFENLEENLVEEPFPFEDYYDANDELPVSGEGVEELTEIPTPDPDYDYEMFLADQEQE